MKYLIALAVASTAAPVLAQTPVPSPAPAVSPAPAALAPIDPARLAAARQTIDYAWPLGTYHRLMSSTMFDSFADTFLDMKLADLMPPGMAGPKGANPQEANATFRDMVAKGDPYFEERIHTVTRVLTTEMAPVFAQVEPDLRDGLARAFARRFTVEQLGDMNRFFATPTGRDYAAQSMLMMMDPEVIKSLIKAAPAMAQAMPQISAKLDAAMKQLPPAPGDHKPAGHSAAAASH